MSNQHAGLSRVLAGSTSTNDTSGPLMRGWCVTLARRAVGAGHGWPVAGGSWPAGQACPRTSQSAARKPAVDRSEVTMSKRARTLILGVALAAINLAGTTAIAQAHTNDAPASTRHRVLGQLALLTGDDAAASQQQPTNAVARFRRGERPSQDQLVIADDSRRPPTEAQVGESWRHPGNVRARPAEPSGQPGWLVLGLGVLAVVLALSGGLAAMILRRTRGRVRVRQVAACMCLWWHLMGPVRPLHVG